MEFHHDEKFDMAFQLMKHEPASGTPPNTLKKKNLPLCIFDSKQPRNDESVFRQVDY